MNLTNQNITTMDVLMLMSIINMKLRSDFSSLKSLCSSYELDQDTLIKRLSDAGYHFDEQQNQFRNNVNNNES